MLTPDNINGPVVVLDSAGQEIFISVTSGKKTDIRNHGHLGRDNSCIRRSRGFSLLEAPEDSAGSARTNHAVHRVDVAISATGLSRKRISNRERREGAPCAHNQTVYGSGRHAIDYRKSRGEVRSDRCNPGRKYSPEASFVCGCFERQELRAVRTRRDWNLLRSCAVSARAREHNTCNLGNLLRPGGESCGAAHANFSRPVFAARHQRVSVATCICSLLLITPYLSKTRKAKTSDAGRCSLESTEPACREKIAASYQLSCTAKVSRPVGKDVA